MLPSRYVPILTGKYGEVIALGALKPADKAALTPLIDVPPIARPHPAKPGRPAPRPTDPTAELRKLIANLAEHWGTTHEVMIDLRGFDRYRPDSMHPVQYVFRHAEDQGLPWLAVVSNRSSDAYFDAVSDVQARLSGRVIRLHASPHEEPASLQSTLEEVRERLQAVPEAVDLILDFGRIDGSGDPDAVEAAVAALPQPTRWRSITLAATPLPASVPSGSFQRVMRSEWTTWIYISQRLPHPLGFADYGVTGPRRDNDDPLYGPAPHLRYTVDDAYLVWKGRKADPEEGGAVESGQTYPDLCRLLMRRSDYRRGRAFRGRSFSWGDRRIWETAERRRGRGGPSEWVQYPTNHHLTLVPRQMQQLSRP